MHFEAVILGGGFAGRRAAHALRRTGRKVALLDPSPVTTMLPLLPDLAGGWAPDEVAIHPLADLLPRNATLIPEAATAIHLNENRLETANQTLTFDQLLIAVGATPNLRPITWSRERVHVLGNLDDARRIRRDFAAYLHETDTPRLLVSGTGYTGLELAVSLHVRARAAGKPCQTTIVDPNPILLPSLPEKQRRHVLDFLTDQGIEVRMDAAVESLDDRQAVAGGRIYERPFFCWTIGSVFPDIQLQDQTETLRDGRLLVQPDLSLPGHPNIFAAGDAAAVTHRGQPLRKAVNFAYYGGLHAGRNMARRLAGRPTRPFRPVDLGWVVPFQTTSVGRLPGNIWIRGRLGVRLHHLMCGVRNYSFKNFAGCVKLAWKGNPT